MTFAYLKFKFLYNICYVLSLRKKHKDTRTSSELYHLYHLYFVISYLLLLFAVTRHKVAYI